MDKFEAILAELERRGHGHISHYPTESGYILDAVITPNIAILATPSVHGYANQQNHKRKLDVLKTEGWKVFLVPRGKLSEEQIKGFVDKIEAVIR
jgi:hypothetical protein